MTTKLSIGALRDVFVQCRDMDAPLGTRLATFADAVRAASPTFADAVDRLVDRLKKSDAGVHAPGPGDVMPSFLLPDETGRLISLEDLLREGPTAVIFHRGHWCPYCRINSDALAKAQEEVQRQGGRIVAIMPERQQFAAELKAETKAPFPILTDMDNGYAMSLNLAIWVGEEMQRLIKEAGWDIASYQGNDSWLLPIPATFVVGTDGRIVSRYVDPDYRRRMEIEDMVHAIADAGQSA
jgi:peroxiredoxin